MKAIVSFSIFLLIFSMHIIPIHGETIQIVTDNGNIITVVIPLSTDSISGYDVNDGTSIGAYGATGNSTLDGLGASLQLETVGFDGRVFYGDSSIGKETAMRPYIPVDSNTTWSAVIQNSDAVSSIVIPKFNAEYNYNGSTLTEIPVIKPNILGYSTHHAWASGRGDMTHSSPITINDGLHPNYRYSDTSNLVNIHQMDGQSVILTGTNPQNHDMQVVTVHPSIYKDYTNPNNWSTARSGHYPVIYDSNDLTTVSTIYQDGSGIWSYSKNSYEKEVSLFVPLYYGYNGFTVIGNASDIFSFGDGYNSIKRCPLVTSYDSTVVGKYTHITKLYMTGCVRDVYTPEIFVKAWGPWEVQLNVSARNFEIPFVFPDNSFLYFYNRGISDDLWQIKATPNNPKIDAYLKISGLTPNTPFEITKGDISGAWGVTTSDGELFVTTSQINFGQSTIVTGVLKLYPDSMVNRGSHDTQLYDVMNHQKHDITFGNDLIYVAPAFMRLSFLSSTVISNLSVGDVMLPYLNKTYDAGESLLIPVIPASKMIHMDINGNAANIAISSVASSTVIRAIPESDSFTTDFGFSESAIASSDVTSTVAFIATRSGQMAASITGNVSGESEFTINAQYTGLMKTRSWCTISGTSDTAYACRISHTPVEPNVMQGLSELSTTHHTNLLDAINDGHVMKLVVYADVFRNGVLSDAPIKLHEVSLLNATTSTSAINNLKNWTAGYTTKMTFLPSNFSSVVLSDVELGDFVELQIRVNLQTRGIPAPVSGTAELSSFAKATTTFHGGSVIVGMS